MYQQVVKQLKATSLPYNVSDRLMWVGRLVRKHGNIIIHNQNRDNGWIWICYHSSGDTFVCLSTRGDLDDLKQIQKLWYGQQYNKQRKLVYQGDFQYFTKHSQGSSNSFSLDYSENGDVKEIYLGKYYMNLRHDQNTKILTINQSYEGRWEQNNKQGPFKVTKNGINKLINPTLKKSPFAKIQEYRNDVLISQQITPKPFPELNYEFEETIRYQVDVSSSLYESLNESTWLTSGAVDFFFKHLHKSYNDYQNHKQQICCWTTFMFEKYVPSSLVYSNFAEKYEAVSAVGMLTKFTGCSIFEIYPIILMPMNMNQSHFVLGGISTKVKRKLKIQSNRQTQQIRKVQYLESIDFTFYYLDSLGNTQDYVIDHLINYVNNQITTNISETDQEIYKIGLSNCKKINYSTRKFSLQQNYDDCGIFTCIFGLLLAVEEGLGVKVSWGSEGKITNALREFIRQDIVKQNNSLFQSLLNLLKENGIIN